jgi:hypothetical protein
LVATARITISALSLQLVVITRVIEFELENVFVRALDYCVATASVVKREMIARIVDGDVENIKYQLCPL